MRSSAARMKVCPLRCSENSRTTMALATAQSQKRHRPAAVLGAAPPASAAAAAVARGSRAVITATCAAVCSRSARASDSGYSTALPAAATASGTHSWRVGQRARRASRHSADTAAANTTRLKVMNSADMAGASASPLPVLMVQRVMGKVAPNSATASTPSAMPAAGWRGAGFIGRCGGRRAPGPRAHASPARLARRDGRARSGAAATARDRPIGHRPARGGSRA